MTQQAAAAGPRGRANGWVQPEHRQCVHLYVSGQRCRGTSKTGERFCHTHQRFAETDPMYPVKVPLLEDPDSIRLVLSQTAQALAVGTLPPANARAMTSACRISLDLLLFELAREKFRAQQKRMGGQGLGNKEQGLGNREQGAEDRDKGLGNRDQESGDGDPSPALPFEEPLEMAADHGENPLPLEERSDRGEAAGAVGKIVPRFPDLREQWKAGLARSESAVERNLSKKEGETAESWLERQRRPIEAGHPQARAGAGRDPGAEAREGACGPNELPFDPQCPPTWRKGLMEGWLPEHIGAWYRALNPTAGEKEVQQFVRAMWDFPRADALAGWRDPADGPAEDCVFWPMREEEIAAWLRAQIPDATENEARHYAETRVRLMEEASRARAVGV